MPVIIELSGFDLAELQYITLIKQKIKTSAYMKIVAEQKPEIGIYY